MIRRARIDDEKVQVNDGTEAVPGRIVHVIVT